ncbi:DUF7373 family lipoprotein [Nocardia bovistercoris]|uniref:Lipoprotein n=1 Tax=Nocardia bovistercoris TaxID=2785916 RepID=A0A931N359_9NOCA|nr:hypothetical protein [Nocardia bovistercoris]MBH0777544.1 hypothetical protein [Nocardia bovistercoris]
MVRISRIALAAACVVIAGVAAGCGGVDGTAVPGEVDVRKLEVGTYPVDAHRYDQNSAGKGSVLEGIRMADAVAPTYLVDPSLRYGRGSTVVADSAKAIDFVANVSKPVLDKRKFVVGFSVSGADNPDPKGDTRPTAGTTAITNFVMRFPDETAAKLAARELEDADLGVSPDNRKLPSNKYPDAYVHWRPGVANVGAFYAHKEFVVSLFIQRPRADGSDLLDWVERTLAAQTPRLDSFRATPVNQLDSLKVDPEGLLARVAVADRKGHVPDGRKFAIYGPDYAVHSASDESATRKLLDDTGTDKIAVVDGSLVFRTRGVDASRTLIDGLVNTMGVEFDPVTAPNDVPNAKCLKLNAIGDNDRDFRYRCYVPYKRYVGLVTSDKEPDVRQKVAAQYALLANSL